LNATEQKIISRFLRFRAKLLNQAGDETGYLVLEQIADEVEEQTPKKVAFAKTHFEEVASLRSKLAAREILDKQQRRANDNVADFLDALGRKR